MQYPERVRIVRLIFLLSVLAAVSPAVDLAQQPLPGAVTPKDQMFSGTVTAVGDGWFTALRTGTSTDAHTFLVTVDTQFEGPKPEINSRVTVRYIPKDEGDLALRVIVRTPPRR